MISPKNYLFLLLVLVVPAFPLQAMEIDEPATKKQKTEDVMDIEQKNPGMQLTPKIFIPSLYNILTNYALNNFNTLDPNHFYNQDVSASVGMQYAQFYVQLQLPEIIKFFGEKTYLTEIKDVPSYDNVKHDKIKKFLQGFYNALHNNVFTGNWYKLADKFIYFDTENEKKIIIIDKTVETFDYCVSRAEEAKTLEELVHDKARIYGKRAGVAQAYPLCTFKGAGGRLAIQYLDKTIEIIDIHTGELIQRFNDIPILSFSLNHDGSLIAFRVGDFLRICEIQSGNVIFTSSIASDKFAFAKKNNKVFCCTPIEGQFQYKIIDLNDKTECILPIKQDGMLKEVNWSLNDTYIQVFNEENAQLICYIINLKTHYVDVWMPSQSSNLPTQIGWLTDTMFGFSVNDAYFIYDATSHQYVLYEYCPKRWVTCVSPENEELYSLEDRLSLKESDSVCGSKTIDGNEELFFHIDDAVYRLMFKDLKDLNTKYESCKDLDTIDAIKSLVARYEEKEDLINKCANIEGRKRIQNEFLEIAKNAQVPECVKEVFGVPAEENHEAVQQ